MNEYYFHVVILNNCSFSNAAKEILINSNIKTTFTNVNSDNKNYYKTDKINTFPQIYFKKEYNKGS